MTPADNPRDPGWCDTCQNTGTIYCHCGGDLCICGEYEIECPDCGGMGGGEDDDYYGENDDQ